MMIDKEACVSYCAFEVPEKGTKCSDTFMTNSIAAGCPYVGFAAPSYPCDEVDSRVFYNNVAHSVDGSGAHIYPNPADGKSATCMEGSHFFAYKNQENSISGQFASNEQRYHDMVLVDNAWGINVQVKGETEYALLRFYNSFVYGESDDTALDCPEKNGCICLDKFGLHYFSANQKGKDIHITGASGLPMMKIKSPSAWGGTAEIENVLFANFKHHET